MGEFFSSALESIGAAAQSGYALVAYGIAIVGYTLIAYRVKRNSNLLNRLKDLPEKDRLKALRDEMGSVVPDSISPQDWLLARRQSFVFLAYALTILLATSIGVLAYLHFDGKLGVTVTGYRLPASPAAGSLEQVKQREPISVDLSFLGLGVKSEVAYRYTSTTSGLTIEPYGPYLSSLSKGERVREFGLYGDPLSWEFPMLSIKVQNNSNDVVELSELELKVRKSKLNQTPLLLVRGHGFYGRLNLKNEGWGKVLQPMVELTIEPAQSCEDSSPHSTQVQHNLGHGEKSLQDFDYEQRIDVSDVISKTDRDALRVCNSRIELACLRTCTGISPSRESIRCADKSTTNEECLNVVGTLSPRTLKSLLDEYEDDKPEALKSIRDRISKMKAENQPLAKIEQAEKEFSRMSAGAEKAITYERSCEDFPVCVSGDLHYKTEDGTSETFRFKALTYFVGPGAGAPLPPTFQYDAFLEAGKSDYTLNVPISQSVKPKDADHFVLRLASNRSADFELDVLIRDASHRVVLSQHVALSYFLPRSIVESRLKKATLRASSPS